MNEFRLPIKFNWELASRRIVDTTVIAEECGKTLGFKLGSVGPKVSFTKKNNANPTIAKDVIIPGALEITRGNNGGIYNIAVESNYNAGSSPLFTAWSSQYVDPANTSWAPLWDISNRSFDTWKNAITAPDGSPAPPMYVGMPVIMTEQSSGRFWLIIFTEWTSNGNGGGFAYDRYDIYPEVFFAKPDYATSTVDKISDGVWLARNDNGGLYNATSETSSDNGESPFNTRWNSIYTDSRPDYSGYTDLSNLESRVYTSFVDALDNNVGNNLPGTDLIMHDLTTDLYWKITFSVWTQGGSGGGFEYNRQVIPQSCNIKFADGTVLNTAPVASGGGSTCCSVDNQGNYIAANSGNDTVIVGAGASHDIPDFSGMVIINDHFNGGVELWLCGGGPTAVLVSSTPYGPGAGSMTINGGINGYTWTNTNNQLGPFTFTIVKTRNGA